MDRPVSQFDVLEQCYCVDDAPQDHYPDFKGVCQYCMIKKIFADTMRENKILREALEEALPLIKNCDDFGDIKDQCINALKSNKDRGEPRTENATDTRQTQTSGIK